MKTKNINKRRGFSKSFVILFLFALSVTHCNFLNVDHYFEDTLNYDSVFANKNNLERYLWATPPFFPDPSNIYGTGSGTDELFFPWLNKEYTGNRLTQGLITPDDLGDIGPVWGNMYKVIRRVNLMFSKLDNVSDLTKTGQRTFRAYGHFFRGWAYYNLLQNWGPLLIVGDDLIETNQEVGYYNKQRSTYDESIDYICNEFEQAAKFLPSTVPISQFGRPTKGAALACIARLRLQAASPLYNGQDAARQYFGDWKRKSDGVHYVSQTYDPQKWAIAAQACKRVIDLGMYELHTVAKTKDTPTLPTNVPSGDFPNGAGGIDPYHSYKDIFDGEAVAIKNKEIIFGRWSSYIETYTRQCFPPQKFLGYNGIAIPQPTIDLFYMEDGKQIDASSSEYPYSEASFLAMPKNFSGYILGGGSSYPVRGMYNNREMRFYASVGFSGRNWPMTSTVQKDYYNIFVSYAFDGNAGKASTGSDVRNYPVTGHVSVKYVHPDDAWAGQGSTRIPKCFPIIRYAEILLSYAEALNNIEGSFNLTNDEGVNADYSRDVNEIANAFNQVRFRAGLPGLSDLELNDRDKLEEVIRRERQIEFFSENMRFYDVRRWGIYTTVDKPENWAYGMNTEVAYAEGFFDRTPISHQYVRDRIVNKKMVWMPIMRGELRKVPLMEQNPGWD